LKALIETVIDKEIQQDEGVFADGYTIEPVTMDEVLKGDGKPEEISTTYQIDIFYKAKGQLLHKAVLLAMALKDYPMSGFIFTWESNARLWRGTTSIEKI